MPVDPWRDVRRHPRGSIWRRRALIAVIALVGQDDAAGGRAFEQLRAGLTVGDLPAGQQEGERATERVANAWILVVRSPRERRSRLGLLPPFGSSSAAMSLHGGGVDQHPGGRASGLGERLEQADPAPLAAQHTNRL